MDKDEIIALLKQRNVNLQDEIHALKRDKEDKILTEKENQRLSDELDGFYQDYDEKFEEQDINLFIANEKREKEKDKQIEKLKRDKYELKRQVIIRDKELGQQRHYFDGYRVGKTDGFQEAKSIYDEQIVIKNKWYADNYQYVQRHYYSRNQAIISFTCEYALQNRLRDLLLYSGNGQFIYQYAANGRRRKPNPTSQLIFWCRRFGLIHADKAKKLQDFLLNIHDPIMHYNPIQCVKLTLDFIQKSMDEVYEIIAEISLKINGYN